jgi:hypothetical protein
MLARAEVSTKWAKLVGCSPHRARYTIIKSTFEVGRRFGCTMRVDWVSLAPVAIQPEPG